jgi:hypothetical protein
MATPGYDMARRGPFGVNRTTSAPTGEWGCPSPRLIVNTDPRGALRDDYAGWFVR